MPRQTELSLEDICYYLEQSRLTGGCGACHGGSLPYPPCLLVNELGTIAMEERNKEAEAKLRDIMEWPQDELRVIAYFYAMFVDNPSEETANAIVAFGAKPENQEIMKRIDEVINRGVVGNRSI